MKDAVDWGERYMTEEERGGEIHETVGLNRNKKERCHWWDPKRAMFGTRETWILTEDRGPVEGAFVLLANANQEVIIAQRSPKGLPDNWDKIVSDTKAEWWSYIGGHAPPPRCRLPKGPCGLTVDDLVHNLHVCLHPSAL